MLLIDMLNPGMSKSEIENALENKGDFVQIDWLIKYLDNNLNRDIKKFIFLRLAELYEKKLMFKDAAKMYNNLGIIAIAFTEKIQYYVKEAKTFIKIEDFDSADKAMKKALYEANNLQKKDIYREIKHFYKQHAQEYENQRKRKHATRVYEKLLEMKINEQERKEIKEKLLKLYQKLGERRKYEFLKGIYG